MGAPFIDPGQLKCRARFERQPLAADSFTAQSWAPVATVWASVRPARSSEARLADAQQAVLTHTVLVRWSATLGAPIGPAEWRVVYRDRGAERTLSIVGPGRDVQGAGHWIIFDCVEGLADGH